MLVIRWFREPGGISIRPSGVKQRCFSNDLLVNAAYNLPSDQLPARSD